MKEDHSQEILENIKKRAEEKGFELSANAEKIARAKNMMFGIDEWQRCPCDAKNPERFCISARCARETKENGHCHCNCYLSKK